MTPDDIGAAVQAGSLTHQQGIAVYSTLYGKQPDALPLALPCEECGRLTPLAVMVSYKLWVAMPGHPAVAGYDEHDQHFCCSHDCARAQLVACFDTHLRPDAERRCLAAAQAQAQARPAVSAPAIVATIDRVAAAAQRVNDAVDRTVAAAIEQMNQPAPPEPPQATSDVGEETAS